jgi:hypothetical protein
MAVRKEKVKQQFTEALAGVLEPGEHVQAGAYGPSGPNPFFAAGLFGILGMLLFGVRYYYVGVTDRRVVFMKSSFWPRDRPVSGGRIRVVRSRSRTWTPTRSSGTT